VKKIPRICKTISYIFLLLFISFCLQACGSTSKISTEESQESPLPKEAEFSEESAAVLEPLTKESEPLIKPKDNTLTLLFAGDIMAHSVNYAISDYPKIWRDVKDLIEPCDLAFANIEAPIDDTQPAQNYPNFNMPQAYVEAAIDAGFNVFSLCNNHTNDQGLEGIKETQKTVERLIKRSAERGENIYFSGLKENAQAPFSYNLIEYQDWKLLFIPITEILNRPAYSDYINFQNSAKKTRTAFIDYVKKIRSENPCDLLIISIHANEPEYTRAVTKEQDAFYMSLLEAGADIIWANHAHIIKDRKYIFYHESQSQKVIMYANGNTISGQRTRPELTSNNPIGERDNTGDGLMVKLTFKKENEGNPPQIINSENFFITTYINTAYEYVIKPLNQDFIDYLWEVPRENWAKYIQRRIDINKEYTKDYILWQ